MDYKRFLSKKNIIIIGLILFLLVGSISISIYIHNNTPNDGLKYNKNKTFTKKQEVKGIVFKNI